MKKITRFMLVFSLLGLALVCYSIGFKLGSMLLLALGLILELAFWCGIISSASKTDSSEKKSSTDT